MNEPETIQTILSNSKTVAIIGLSEKPERPSYGVAKYLQQHGYRIVPINPEVKRPILGEETFASLEEACGARRIDLVDVFRASVFVPEIVKEVMRMKIPYLWLQEGVCHEEAAEWAEKDGIKVVMDRCIMKDHAALPAKQ
jgi:predicted CoA-binding protein